VEGQGGERGDGWRIVGPMGTTTGEYRALPNKMARRSAWGRSGREGREGEGRDCLDNGGAQTSGGRLRILGGERGRDGTNKRPRESGHAPPGSYRSRLGASTDYGGDWNDAVGFWGEGEVRGGGPEVWGKRHRECTEELD